MAAPFVRSCQHQRVNHNHFANERANTKQQRRPSSVRWREKFIISTILFFVKPTDCAHDAHGIPNAGAHWIGGQRKVVARVWPLQAAHKFDINPIDRLERIMNAKHLRSSTIFSKVPSLQIYLSIIESLKQSLLDKINALALGTRDRYLPRPGPFSSTTFYVIWIATI